MTKTEAVARALYDQFPNGVYKRINHTHGGSPTQVDDHFVADKWEDASDRHEQCLSMATAAIEAADKWEIEIDRLARAALAE